MRDYQTAFTIKDLRKFIKHLPSNTKLVIHDKDGNTTLVESLLYWRAGAIADNELIVKLGKEIGY